VPTGEPEGGAAGHWGILLISKDADGTRAGYNSEMTRAVAEAVEAQSLPQVVPVDYGIFAKL
jgi:imidazole glycerol phosphate synthase subunit HisF